ncbi:MAG: polysaccharide lyase 10 [Candidatus Latescibacteria bacterium]|nr:polysaccharide lyase 10 [Candidatus Latescibacterota bacterium]
MVRFFYCITFISLTMLLTTLTGADPKEKDVLEAMKYASRFMMDTVSTNGGFVWNYSADLSERWGEVPARDTQIWVQGASNGVGEMFLAAYEATGDQQYLDYAKNVADAIIWGQYPSGGWHYLIDFDMAGIEKWYDEVASKCWGWEEYYQYYGNCTFDDDATASSVRFLMKMYTVTLDPAYRVPLMKALDFILEAQFPNGAWPQRYPLMFNHPHNGHPDYTSYYTFNDGVIPNNINLLLEAYDDLGDERYFTAARRAMDFYLISQGPEEQAGWAQQYDWNMQPAWARSYEPPAYQPTRTMYSIYDLMKFYKITGDRRYLKPIPLAINWIEKSALGPEYTIVLNANSTRKSTHARYYQPGTNLPLFVHRKGTNIDNGSYYADQDPENLMCHLSMSGSYDIEGMKAEYNRVKTISPEEAHIEYLAEKNASEKIPDVDFQKVQELISSLDKRGAWITDITIPYYYDPCKTPRRTLKGISTRTYQNNMYTLINYIKSKKRG